MYNNDIAWRGVELQKKNVQQADIAERLHISRTTVARALAGRNVSEKTRQKVLATAKEMGYVSNVAAEILAQKKNKVVYCFIIGTIDEGYVHLMIEGINDAVNNWRDYNFEVRLFVTDINESGDMCVNQIQQFYEAMEKETPAGVVFSALSRENMDSVTDYCGLRHIPVISLDVIYRNDKICHVGSDYYSFGVTTASYLVSLMQYRGKLLTLSYDDGYELSSKRMKGFFNRITECKNITTLNIPICNMQFDTYKNALAEHLETFAPDAVFAPYKMDYIVEALQELQPEKSYILVSNGINEKVEEYLYNRKISGIISNRPYQLGYKVINNFFKYFYRPLEFKKGIVDIGFDIYIRENYEKFRQQNILTKEL